MPQELRPIAITLDVMMPDIDGWTVLAALKGDPELADIPVIMVDDRRQDRKGYALGAAELPDQAGRTRAARRTAETVWRARPADRPYCWSKTTRCSASEVRCWLEPQDWLVSEAENGRVALDRLAAETPDLILLDLMMPEMDGFQLIAALQEKPQWRSIPVIVITALDLTAADHARLNSGVEAIFLKELFDRRSSSKPSAIWLRKAAERRICRRPVRDHHSLCRGQ